MSGSNSSSTYVVSTTTSAPTTGFIVTNTGSSSSSGYISGTGSGSITTTHNTQGSSYPICSAGTYWQPASSMCISGNPSSTFSNTSGSCSQGLTWNGVGCSANGGSNNCAAGSYWNGNSCLTS